MQPIFKYIMHLEIKWLWKNRYILRVQDLENMKSNKLLDEILLKRHGLNMNQENIR